MADSTSSGGLMGLDPNLLMSLGMGLLSGAKYGSNAGEGLLRGMENYRQGQSAQIQNALGTQQLQMNQLQMQKLKALMDMAGGLMGPPATSQPNASTAAAPTTNFMSSQQAQPPAFASSGGLTGIGSAPQITQGLMSPSALSQPTPASAPQMPSMFQAPSAQDIYSQPVGGLDPRKLESYSLLSGKDPLQTTNEIRQQQLALAKEKYAPILAKLDTIRQSDSPLQYLQADPDLKAAWPSIAQALGMDAANPTDQNVRTALTYQRNALAASLQEATAAPTVPMTTTRGPLGSIFQTEPTTGKLTQVKPEEDLQQVIGKNGQPMLVPKSQAAGMTPFNASIFGAANATDQAIQFAADSYRTTGKMPAAFGRNPLMQAKVLDRVAQDATANGDSAGAIAARAASLKANGQALDQLTKQESATTSYYNTLDKNLTNLQELSGKVSSSGVPLLNKVYRAYQQGISGDKEVAQYVTMMRSVESEFAKIQSGALGNQGVSDASRREAQDVINKFMSQGQINAVADAMRQEGNNRLQSIREQRQSLTGALGTGAPGAPGTQSTAPSNASSPSLRNAKGWELHQDAQGRKAYVSPDGKQYELVR